MDKLRWHNITLDSQTRQGLPICLRPMTEDDWDVLYRWNNDPAVLYYAEGDDITSYALEEVQELYRTVSQKAFCFIMEVNGQPIGECWLQELQEMSLERILCRYPGLDLRRIDLMIGETAFWGQGIGTAAIRLLTRFGFGQGADMIWGCEVADYNVRSRKAFERNGYHVVETIRKEPGGKADYTCDLALRRDMFERAL